jgi:small-conductance mechanosensitive channel
MMEWMEGVAPSWLPAWLLSLVVLAAGALLALAAHQVLVTVVRRLIASRDEFWRELVKRTRRPSRLAALILGLGAAAPLARLQTIQLDVLARVLLIGFIVLCGWAALTALDIATLIYTRRFRTDVEDNLLARKHVTQTRILRRTAAALIVVLTIAFALMTFNGVRQYGVSLLASAGAAGIIAGLALQPFLTNLIAGIQIATTQPIRLDDAVIVEGEWGRIEEIGSTYVVVKLWDWRRMVLPLTYFIQKPFQNWTRESASLIGTAMVYVDYSAPIEVLRSKLEEIAAASPLWDRNVVNLAVTELSERTMQVRCLTSARNAGEAFDLRCEVREKMVAFLQNELPHALPRERFDLRAAGPA